MDARTRGANWLWLIDLKPGDTVIVSPAFAGLLAVPLEALRVRQAPSAQGAPAECAAAILTSGTSVRELTSVRARLRSNGTVCLAHGLVKTGLLQRLTLRTPTLHENERRLTDAGFRDARGFRIGPELPHARFIVPDAPDSIAAFLSVDEVMRRAGGSLRARIARAGFIRTVLSGHLAMADA